MNLITEIPSARWFSDKYALDIGSIELVQRGVNQVYRLDTAQGRYFLRVSPDRGRAIEDIELELRTLLCFRNSSGTRVSRPVISVDTELIFRLPDDCDCAGRPVTLFEEAPGSFPDQSRAALFSLGSHLARLHAGLNTGDTKSHPPLLPPGFGRNAAELLSAFKRDLGPLRQLVHEMGEFVESHHERATGQLIWGLCHGDVWFRNVHVLGHEATFFDFERLGVGPLAFDIATIADRLEKTDLAEYRVLLREIVSGYRAVQRLQSEDIEAIPYLAVANQLKAIMWLAEYDLLSAELWLQAAKKFSQRFDFWRHSAPMLALAAPNYGR